MNISHRFIRLRSRGGAFAHDFLMIPLAWLGALWLRFNLDSIPAEFLDQALAVLPVIVVVQSAVFAYFGLYRGVWRFASVPDLVRIFQSIVVGVALCAVVAFLMTRMVHIPRTSFLLHGGLLLVLLSGPRLAYRWFKDRRPHDTASKNALIVGAGRAGEMLARSLLRDPSHGFCPIGFIDDDPNKKGREVRGIRVLGHCERIAEIAKHTGAGVIIVATPGATTAQMRRIVELCERAELPMRIIPHMAALVSDRTTPSELRAIAIEDLLDRKPVRSDWPMIRSALTARTILVTGGGGSIGSELCRQIASLDPSRLIIVDISEFNLYRTELKLRAACPAVPISVVLADICDEAAIERLFERHRPDVVFHAAAYKQVPMLEGHVREAIRVNTLGTQTVARAAAACRVDCFVLVSSDKAVNPVNTMGASKRLAEMVCRVIDEVSPATRFIAVRFGNVLDSSGSVVPLFREQIAAGGPVTVTDPRMKRYFMTIPEACQLIMASATMGEGGEVFVLDMGEPIQILYLAEQMIRLAGKVPGEEVAIELIGPRPGEKLSEELFHSTESCGPTGHEKIFLARSRPVEHAGFTARLARLRAACDAIDEPELGRVLSELVPEYFCPIPHRQDPPRRQARRPSSKSVSPQGSRAPAGPVRARPAHAGRSRRGG